MSILQACQNLLILDISDNPVISSNSNYRMFVIYHLSTLKALDGQTVDPGEVTNAREMLGGRLTCDFIVERVGHSVFANIKELDLPQLSLRSIDLGNSAQQFSNLRSVNLEHNNLTSLGGLVHLPSLRVCLIMLFPSSDGVYGDGCNECSGDGIGEGVEVVLERRWL